MLIKSNALATFNIYTKYTHKQKQIRKNACQIFISNEYELEWNENVFYIMRMNDTTVSSTDEIFLNINIICL